MSSLVQLDLPVQTPVAQRRASLRLSVFALAVVIANVLAATLAVTANWPSQFGGVVGTDADKEWLSRGTAISAPVAPVVCLLLVAILVRIRNRVGWLGVAMAFVTAAVVLVGGVGELVAEPTVDVPRAVLVGAGLWWGVIAVVFVVLGAAAARERRGWSVARVSDRGRADG